MGSDLFDYVINVSETGPLQARKQSPPPSPQLGEWEREKERRLDQTDRQTDGGQNSLEKVKRKCEK